MQLADDTDRRFVDPRSDKRSQIQADFQAVRHDADHHDFFNRSFHHNQRGQYFLNPHFMQRDFLLEIKPDLLALKDAKRTRFSSVDRIDQNQALGAIEKAHQFDAERTAVEYIHRFGKVEAL